VADVNSPVIQALLNSDPALVDEAIALYDENELLRAEVEKLTANFDDMRKQRDVLCDENDALRLVRDAAHDWWLGKRPVGWGREEHHANPEINTTSLRERRLAEACAALDAAKASEEKL